MIKKINLKNSNTNEYIYLSLAFFGRWIHLQHVLVLLLLFWGVWNARMYVYFSRRCPAWQISNGIRKETWEKQTILQCFQFDANDTNSRHICKISMVFCHISTKLYFKSIFQRFVLLSICFMLSLPF